MKIDVKRIALITFTTLLIGCFVSYPYIKTSVLYQQFLKKGLLTEALQTRGKNISLIGNSLVLYQVTHKDYPDLMVRRLQIQDSNSSFKFKLQGLQGSLISSFQKADPYAFKRELTPYSPAEDLLKKMLISLTILGYDDINFDVSIKATLTAPNQIFVEWEVFEGHKKLARFISKFTPTEKQASIYEQLKKRKIFFQLDYLNTTWKQKIDDYCFSKNVPFVMDLTNYEFTF